MKWCDELMENFQKETGDYVKAIEGQLLKVVTMDSADLTL